MRVYKGNIYITLQFDFVNWVRSNSNFKVVLEIIQDLLDNLMMNFYDHSLDI
jgi:hypothetical protein